MFFAIIFDRKIIPPNGSWLMHQEPVPQDPGRDGDPPRVPSWPDWMDDPAYLAARAEDEDPGDLDLDEDPAPPGLDDAGVLDDAELEALIAEAREVTAGPGRAGEAAARLDRAATLAAMGAVAAGRRGPGMPGLRRRSAASTPAPRLGSPARRPGSAAVSRWTSRRGARRWGCSWRMRPGRMTGTPGRPMMSCWG
jgi:hypothetical protein